MTTEQKIKEAFEAQYGSRNEWRDMRAYDSAMEDFSAGYLALLNSLELEQCRKDAERYRWLRDKAEFATPHDPFVAEYQCSNDECPGLYRDELDAAIDKAMESV